MTSGQRNTSTASYFPMLLGLFFIATAILIHRSYTLPDVKIDKQQTAVNFNQSFINILSTGNKRLLSNILWIQTLLESDNEKYKKSDRSNWMYLRFLTIANLDPLFYENYLYGGMYLSVIKDDLEGAAHIFELGLEKYPLDYQLNYYAGFNYFFEMGEMEKGLHVLEKIESHPRAPESLKYVVSRLRYQVTGDYDLAMNFIQEGIRMAKTEAIKSKLLKDLYALKAHKDLECLNSGKTDCDQRDAKGQLYQKGADGKWTAQDPFREYRIFRRKSED